MTKKKKKMLWSHPHSYQERPNGRPTFPLSWAYNKVLTSLPGWHQRKPSRELELLFLMASKKALGHNISGDPVENLDFHPYQEIKSCPTPLFQDGVRESTAESGFSPLPSGSMAIFTVVISIYPSENWNSHPHPAEMRKQEFQGSNINN